MAYINFYLFLIIKWTIYIYRSQRVIRLDRGDRRVCRNKVPTVGRRSLG